MTTEQFREIMKSGARIVAGSPAHLKMHELAAQARKITSKINRSFCPKEKIRKLFCALIGKSVDDTFVLFPPFYTDCGKNIKIGKNVFLNSGCCFQDQGGLEIGDGTLIGQQVVIATLNHAEDPTRRADMFPKPVRIGKNVWVGAKATILPGVRIGENSIIGAGAVVTKDVPSGVIAVGNPAKVIREIKETGK